MFRFQPPDPILAAEIDGSWVEAIAAFPCPPSVALTGQAGISESSLPQPNINTNERDAVKRHLGTFSSKRKYHSAPWVQHGRKDEHGQSDHDVISGARHRSPALGFRSRWGISRFPGFCLRAGFQKAELESATIFSYTLQMRDCFVPTNIVGTRNDIYATYWSAKKNELTTFEWLRDPI